MSPRTRRNALRALLFVAVVALFIDLELNQRAKHLVTVEPGVLYRSATLPPDQLEEVIDRYQIKTVVNLRSVEEREESSWYADQAGVLARKGVALRDLPMYSGWPPNKDVLEDWLEIMGDPAQHPYLVHCEHGVVRTGIMMGVRDLELGFGDPSAAYENLEYFGKPVKEPIRSRIQEYLRSYSPRSEAQLSQASEAGS